MIKNKVLYCIVLAITFWLMIMYEGVFIEGLFVTTIVVECIAVILKYIQRKQLDADLYIEKKAVDKNEEFYIRIKLSDDLFAPANKVEIKYELTDNVGKKRNYVITTNLKANTAKDCYEKFKVSYAGLVCVKLKSIKVYDMFCITSAKKMLNKEICLEVKPDVYDMEVTLLENINSMEFEGEVYSKYFSGNDRSEIFEVRKYEDSDNIKDIYWKLSLKNNELMVKNYSLPISDETNIYVDLNIDKNVSGKGVDHFWEYTYSLIKGLKTLGEKVNIYVFLENEDVIKIDEEYLMSRDYRTSLAIETVTDVFKKKALYGRNILVTSRIRESGESYFAMEADALSSFMIVGVDVSGEEKEKNISVAKDFWVNDEEKNVSVYSWIQRAILSLFGSFGAVGMLSDAILYDDNKHKVFLYSFLGVIFMTGMPFIKKKFMKFLYVMWICIMAFLFAGVTSVATGFATILSAFGNYMQFEILEYGREFGLILEYDECAQAVMYLLAFILSTILYQIAWKQKTFMVNMFITLPLVAVCFSYGQVPDGIQMVAYTIFVFMLVVGKTTFKAAKVANENYTIDISSICGYIVALVVALTMFIDFTKGYNRGEWLYEAKMSIVEAMDDIYKDVVDGGSTYTLTDDGKLGSFDEVKIKNEVMLRVTLDGELGLPVYLKGFTGSDYLKNRWASVYDDQNNYIVERLSLAGYSLSDAAKLPYNITKSDYERISDCLWMGSVDRADIVVENIDKNDKHIYLPYGADTKNLKFRLDGILEEGDGEYSFEVYQPGMLPEIQQENILKSYADAEILYREAVDNVYNMCSYWRREYEEFYYNEMNVEFVYCGDTFDLTDGYKKNGYEPYVQFVKSYLGNNFSYSLKPGKLEEGEDFIEKFLEDKKGYCSHFATLATIMFRMYGIPARYCEGFVVKPEGMELFNYEENGKLEIEVTDEFAHAWTEIYIDGYGWYPIEVTPGYSYVSEGITRPKKDKEKESTEKKQENFTKESFAEKNTKEAETTSKVEETEKVEQTSEDVSENNNVSSNDKEDGLGNSLKIIAVVIMVSLIAYILFGITKRIVYVVKRKRKISAKILKMEVEKTLNCVEITFLEDVLNKEKAVVISDYLITNLPEKYLSRFNKKQFEEQVKYMYEMFDKSMYGNEDIGDLEFEEVKRIAKLTIRNVYICQKKIKRIYMKYLKCLYLK